MNETQIKNFLAVAEEKSFSRAAEKIFVSQPNLSRSIAKLEEEFGVTLFLRQGKKIQLTEAGRAYYEFFGRMQIAYRDVTLHARNMHFNRLGNIRMGYMEGWKISDFMEQILGTFLKSYPDMDIRMEAYSREELLEKLDRDDIDVVLGIDGVMNARKGLRKERVAEIVRGILCKKSIYADRSDLAPECFRDTTFYVMDEDGSMILGDKVREFCEPYGFVPRIVYVNSFETALNNVELGLGVMICDEWTRAVFLEDLCFVPLHSRHPVSLAWKADTQNVALRVLINEIKMVLQGTV